VKFEVSGAKRPITFPFNYFGAGSKFLEQYTPLVQTGNIATVVDAANPEVTTTGATTGAYPDSAADTGYAKGFPYVDYAQNIFKDTFSFGTLDFSQFSAVLELLKKRAQTDIVSNPRIATMNNSEANILVGQTLNMPKYERNSTTGKIEITGYEAKDLGIKLKVTPHINDKEEIVVDIVPEISDLLKYDTIDATNGIVAPVFTSRQANTKVMIKDGDTIFIGGLIKESVVDGKNTLPIIGEIMENVPFVGLLFNKKEKIKQKTELIFFVTVKIMKKGKQLSDVPLSEKAYAPNYELSQEEWQKKIKKRKIK
jgi:general secretion pathway protein D